MRPLYNHPLPSKRNGEQQLTNTPKSVFITIEITWNHLFPARKVMFPQWIYFRLRWRKHETQDFTHLRLRKRVFPSAEIWRKHAKKWYDSAGTAATETPVNVMYPLTETCDCGYVSATVSHVYVMFQFTDSWNFVLWPLMILWGKWR